MKFTEKERKLAVQWFQKSRKRVVFSGLHMALQFFLGSILGWFLFYGPLESDSTIVQFVGALIFGGANASLWARQKLFQMIGRVKEAEIWQQRLKMGRWAIVLSLAILVSYQAYTLGAFPPLSSDPVRSVNRLMAALERYYPHWDVKDVDWEALQEEYRQRIQNADTEEEYLKELEEFLFQIGDANLILRAPAIMEPRLYLGMVRQVEGQPVVAWTRSGLDLPGLEAGAVLLERDGQTIEDYMETLPPGHRNASTPQQEEFLKYSSLLAVTKEEEITLTYRDGEGRLQEEVVQWDDSFYGEIEEESIISSKVLDSGWGYIKIPTFYGGLGHDLGREFAHALEEVRETPGIILDLRNNSGGHQYVAEDIASYFFSEPVEYGVRNFPARLPFNLWRTQMPQILDPRQNVYEGPLVLLMDVMNAGVTEIFLAIFKDADRAALVGSQSSGAYGILSTFTIPGGQVHYATGEFLRPEGVGVEGRGIEPHYLVAWTLEDVQEDRDSFLEQAIKVLETEH